MIASTAGDFQRIQNDLDDMKMQDEPKHKQSLYCNRIIDTYHLYNIIIINN